MAGTARVFFDNKARSFDAFLRAVVIGVFAGTLTYFWEKSYSSLTLNSYATLGFIGAVSFCADDVLIFLTKLLKNPKDLIDWWQSKGKE